MERSRPLMSELGGAFGDLGTLLPYLLGALLVAGLAPSGVLVGFGAFLIGTGLFYRLPVAVQPMKAVGAVMLTGGLGAGGIAAAGLMIGAVMLALGASGLLMRAVRLVPQSVTAGLQLGLGIAMAAMGLGLMLQRPWIGFGALAGVMLLARRRGVPAVPAVLAIAVAAGLAVDGGTLPELRFGWSPPPLVLPAWTDVPAALAAAVLPQLPLTLANAVIVTAALARALFPGNAARAGERNLALSTGIANLLLAPLGALPMCHGAGGMQAQHRFGARTGAAPAMLGVLLLALGLFLADSAAALLALVPLAAVGALLAVAGADLALSRRLFDARRECWFPIGVTAAVTVAADPALGLAAGWLAEAAFRPAARALRRLRSPGRLR